VRTCTWILLADRKGPGLWPLSRRTTRGTRFNNSTVMTGTAEPWKCEKTDTRAAPEGWAMVDGEVMGPDTGCVVGTAV